LALPQVEKSGFGKLGGKVVYDVHVVYVGIEWRVIGRKVVVHILV
jgi:hypothetical protein